MSRPGFEPGPPAWEASTVEKSHLDSLSAGYLEPLLSRHLLTTFGPLQYVLWMPMINIVREMDGHSGTTWFPPELHCRNHVVLNYLKYCIQYWFHPKQIDGDYRLTDILKGRRGLTLEEREGRGALLVKGRRAHMMRLLEWSLELLSLYKEARGNFIFIFLFNKAA